jgi:hypothetical protein
MKGTIKTLSFSWFEVVTVLFACPRIPMRVKSITYGSIDLLKEPLSIPPQDSAQIVVTLGIAL